MASANAGGVATYARALQAAQRAIDPGSALLVDRGDPMRGTPSDGRALRWLAALSPQARRARLAQGADDGTVFAGRDLFRLAQVWFDVHRRLLPVHVPGPPGVMHWSYPVPLRLAGWRNIYTVHDLIPLTAPDLTPISPDRHRRLLRRIVREAAGSGAIATVSAAARAEIVAVLGCSPDRVSDCGQAVSPVPPTTPPPGGLPRDGYLLVCGSIEPRKNIAALLAAYAASGVALPLVLAGRDGWQAGPLDARIAATPNTIRLGEVDDAAMAALLGNARALVMPSLAEGFGLPVAEAMALGTPVLTSRGGALEETAGGAALLVDPTDEGALADGVRRIAGDAALRQRLSIAGCDNARRFTPARFAARLSTLYQAVAARSAAPASRGPAWQGASA